MSQFISRIDDVQNPGIGDQQVVSQQHVPRQNIVEGFLQGITPVVEKGVQRFTEGKGEQIVREAQSDLDAAVGAIQQHQQQREQTPFITPLDPDIPESVKMSEAQFDVLRAAVESGHMTRDRARLHASKLVRQRISEQPLFSDRIRQSASEFLGFDPMSEQTRQFFMAFPTESQGQENSFLQDRWNQATAIADVTGADPNYLMKRIMEGEQAQIMKEHAQTNYDLNQISGRQYLDDIARNDTQQMYNRVFQSVMSARQEGALRNAEDVNRILEQDKQQHLAEVASGYKGNVTDPEFVRYRKQVNDRYKDVQEYMTSIGVDNINQETLERLETMQSLEARTSFHDFFVLREAAGDTAFNSLLDMLGRARNEDDLQFMMKQFPALEQAYNRLNRDQGALQQQLFGAGSAILTGGELSQFDEGVVDVVSSELHEDGDEEQKTSTIKSLVDNGFEAKPISILSQRSPRFTSRENIEWFKKSYQDEVQTVADRVAAVIANSSRDATFNIDEVGRIEVIGSDETIQGPMGRELRVDMNLDSQTQEAVERLNLFGDAIENRWDRELDTTANEHREMVRQTIQTGIDVRRQRQFESSDDRVMGYLEQGDIGQARTEFNRMRDRFPDRVTSNFDELARAAGVDPDARPPTAREEFEALGDTIRESIQRRFGRD